MTLSCIKPVLYIYLFFVSVIFTGDSDYKTSFIDRSPVVLGISAQHDDRWTRKRLSVKKVLAKEIKASSSKVARNERSANQTDFQLFTNSIQFRLSRFLTSFREREVRALSGQTGKLRRDKTARRPWPKKAKQTGLNTRVLGAMLYLEYIRWVIEMEKKSIKEKQITHKPSPTYRKVELDLYQWLLKENSSLQAREYSEMVSVPFPPNLDARRRSSYGIAITNLVLENLLQFLQCLNKTEDKCTVWNGLRIKRKNRKNKINSEDDKKEKRRRRRKKNSKGKRKGKKERKGNKGHKRQNKNKRLKNKSRRRREKKSEKKSKQK